MVVAAAGMVKVVVDAVAGLGVVLVAA